MKFSLTVKLVVAVVMSFAGQVSAVGAEIEALFPAEGVRYKSCQINLNPAADGHVIDIKRDCPSGYCYNDKLQAKVRINAQQTEVFGKTLTNHHEIDMNSRTTSLQVKEYDKWEEEKSVGLLGAWGSSSERVLIGYVQTKLEMRIDNETGQVERLRAYHKGSVNWGAALRGGILTSLRALHAMSSKVTLVDCESPGIEMHKTLTYLLEEEASVYEPDKVLNYEERESLGNRLLQLLTTAEKSELTDTSVFGNTPLHYAARLGLVNFARQLIPVLPQEATDRYSKRLNPLNFQNSNGHTPLHLAARHGEVDMVKILLATRGVDMHLLDFRDKTTQQLAADNAKKYCEADAASQDCQNAQEIVVLFAE